MAASAGISVEEYLRTSFPDLDKEYRDGELVERSLPTRLHSNTQGLLYAFFFAVRASLRLWPYPELRVKVREGLYLIPDICVFHPDNPTSRVPDTPPFVAIEILSPEDRLAAVRKKLEQYRVWGVQHIWLVDPEDKVLYNFDGRLNEVGSLLVPGLNLEVRPEDIFE
jgi:Uma2 family endonuclease